MPSSYAWWQYAHVVLFVYWLGADLGVFLASRYVARAELPLDERLRFLRLTLQIDLGPRTALILMIPVGVMLASGLGVVSLAPAAEILLWLGALAWLGLAWFLALSAAGELTRRLARLDAALRVVVATVFVAMGAAALTGIALQPLPRWLAAKLLLFGAIVILGLLLRGVIRDWAAAFAQLRQGQAVNEANAAIAVASTRASRLAITLWAAVMLVAWLGVTKPGLG